MDAARALLDPFRGIGCPHAPGCAGTPRGGSSPQLWTDGAGGQTPASSTLGWGDPEVRSVQKVALAAPVSCARWWTLPAPAALPVGCSGSRGHSQMDHVCSDRRVCFWDSPKCALRPYSPWARLLMDKPPLSSGFCSRIGSQRGPVTPGLFALSLLGVHRGSRFSSHGTLIRVFDD